MLSYIQTPISNPYWVAQTKQQKRKNKASDVWPWYVYSAFRTLAGLFGATLASSFILCGLLAVALLDSDPDSADITLYSLCLVHQCLVLILSLTAALMLAYRQPAARILGFICAGLGIIGTPLHIALSIGAIISLCSPQVTEFLDR